MSPRPRPAFALALATALAGTAPLPAAADDPEDLVERCYTQALTREEVLDGERSVVECVEVPVGTPLARRGSFNIAKIFDSTDGTGTFVYVEGTGCTGASAAFGTGNTWNNRIGSTELLACGNAKHYDNANFTGDNILISGTGAVQGMGTMNNRTSSIEYAP